MIYLETYSNIISVLKTLCINGEDFSITLSAGYINMPEGENK